MAPLASSSMQRGYSPDEAAEPCKRQFAAYNDLQRNLHLGRYVADQRDVSAFAYAFDGAFYGGRAADRFQRNINSRAVGQAVHLFFDVAGFRIESRGGAQFGRQAQPSVINVDDE